MATKMQNAKSNATETATPRPVVWFEVVGKDGPALQRFYGKLFDWQISDSGEGTGYGLVAPADKGIGGSIGTSPDGGAGHVTFYIEVDDVGRYLKKAEGLGARTILPVTEMPKFNLTIALFADPEGHVIGLSKGAVQ